LDIESWLIFDCENAAPDTNKVIKGKKNLFIIELFKEYQLTGKK
jgi:hypothetical protein